MLGWDESRGNILYPDWSPVRPLLFIFCMSPFVSIHLVPLESIPRMLACVRETRGSCERRRRWHVTSPGTALRRPRLFLPLQRMDACHDSGSLEWDCLHLVNECKLISWQKRRESKQESASGEWRRGWAALPWWSGKFSNTSQGGLWRTKQRWQRHIDSASPLPGQAGGQTANRVHPCSVWSEWHGTADLLSLRLPFLAALQLPRMIL